jgi:hypothetical protein
LPVHVAASPPAPITTPWPSPASVPSGCIVPVYVTIDLY